MLVKKIVVLVLGFIFLSSCIFLGSLVISDKQYIHPTSYPRLIALIGIHLVIIVYLGILISVELLEEAARWGFYLTASITAFITITELYIFRSKSSYFSGKVTNFSQPPELIYINLYFLLYMFSLIVSFILGIILLTLRCVEWARQRRIELALQINMRQIQFTQCLQGEDCPICLSPFSASDDLCEIACHHKFHRACLTDWIKLNYTCPNCRFNMFTESNNEQEHAV